MDSAAGSPRPSSVDLVMAGAEMQQLRNSVSSWMQQQQREEDEFRGAEASPEIQVNPASSSSLLPSELLSGP